MQSKSISKKEYWQQQTIAAEEYSGTLKEFCKHKGISLNTLQYWRHKFNNEALGKLTQTQTQTQTKNPSPFVAVAFEKAQVLSSLPDAKWVAEFILHLQAGAK